jgi:hypothetical protein
LRAGEVIGQKLHGVSPESGNVLVCADGGRRDRGMLEAERRDAGVHIVEDLVAEFHAC